MWMVGFCLIPILATVSSFYGKYHGNHFGASPPKEIDIFIGQSVELPCRVDEKQCGQLHSVKWYKDSNRVYVMRSAVKSRKERDATNRMTVNYNKNSGNAALEISAIEAEDEATYKCEITYLEVVENCDVVQIVKLKTLKVPDSVKIHLGDGQPITNSTVIGPKIEGDEINLICEAGLGKPIPQVKWFNGSQEIQRAEYSKLDTGGGVGNGISKLDITLARGDLLTNFECRVESPALQQPIVSWLQIDVHVPPLDISLTGVERYVVQGSNVKLECFVRGARPAATVQWKNGTQEINENDIRLSNRGESPIKTVTMDQSDGTITTISSLEFKASHYENGRTFFCFTTNEVMLNNSEPEKQASLILDVRYPPVITVKPLKGPVNETTYHNVTSVFLHCNYFANPQDLKGVMWIKDGKNLTLEDSQKYNGGNIVNPPLYINNVNRDDMGNYSCVLRNEIGSDMSESIHLNVQYTPTVEIIMDPSTPLKAVDKNDVMLMCNVTSGNPSSLLKVRWFLNGDLMKELPECNDSLENGGEFCLIDPTFLNLTKVIETYAGNYTCQGQNAADWGPVSEPQELIVYYSPSPAKLRYFPSEVIKGAVVTLECTVTDPGRPDNLTYLWYRGSHQMAEITSWNFTLKSARVEERSNFTCIAVNEGGQSKPATAYIDVKAPLSFITPLYKYQGILYNSNNISLTCRVECFPICSIIWYKNQKQINTGYDNLYYVNITMRPADLQKNDFESIESTLIWNLTAWPENSLDKFAPDANYTCAATSNGIGEGKPINSTILIAVDYPPEDVKVNPLVVKVIENHIPNPVRCTGKGHPNLTYEWKKNSTSAVIADTEELSFTAPLKRDDSGRYVCEASNRHGKKSAETFFDVLYVPECTVTETEKDGSPALVCIANANPQELNFTWQASELNDTFYVDSNILLEGMRSYLILDTSVGVERTYSCTVKNTVGKGEPCERKVAGNIPWWKQFDKDRLIIIIAAVVAIIIVVIILCIIIIMLCRRKRAQTKYNNTLEMEERENPEGHNPDISEDQSKWPLQPGLLIHINKMNNVNISQLGPRATPYKTTSVKKSRMLSQYKRNKSKVYARLERLKVFLGIKGNSTAVPKGIVMSPGGVVTFRKVRPELNGGRPIAVSRKRKKPGYAPNPSSTADKAKLGAAPPFDYPADPMTEGEKQFYENLPFHGMQNPPNKPISVIAPFNQGAIAPSFTSSAYNQTPNQGTFYNPLVFPDTKANQIIRRNQSFNGFQNRQLPPLGFKPVFNFTNPNNNSHSSSFSNIPHGYTPLQTQTTRPNLPAIFARLPQSFNQMSGANTVAGIPSSKAPNHLQRLQIPSISGTIKNSQPCLSRSVSSVSSLGQRIIGRNENNFDIRRTASGINTSNELRRSQTIEPINSRRKLTTIAEKRFGSLDTKKHKCYSPTFYSLRCKKHAKKRPIVITLPKKCFSELALASDRPLSKDKSGNFENLTDSIQIFEENSENVDDEDLPVPAPRCKKHKPAIYANIQKHLNRSKETNQNSSTDSGEVLENPVRVTKVQLHATNEDFKSAAVSDTENKENVDNSKPKLVHLTPKSPPQKITLSPHALKNSPVLKVSPNFIKPQNESPKGALSRQIQAKMKAPPAQIITESEIKVSADDVTTIENVDTVPQMPVLYPQTVWNSNVANKNAQPYRPDPCDLEYADVDYRSYGPINYKAASIYAAMKRHPSNRLEEVNKDDLL